MPASKIKGITWTTTRLGGVAAITMGQSPPSSAVNEEGIGLPFIQGNAEFGPRSPRPVKFCTEPKKLAAPGDILLSVRAPVGAMNLADEQLSIGRGLSAITAINVDSRFLWYALSRRLSSLARVAQGSTFTAVNKADLHGLEFLLPSPNEQRKIAAILSSVDDAIEKTRAVIDQVQVVKRGLMQELITRGFPGRHTRFKRTEIGEIPEVWEVVELGCIFKLSSGKNISVRSLEKTRSPDNPYPVYGGNGIAGFTSSFIVDPPLIVVGRVGEYCGIVHCPSESCWVSDNALYTQNWLRARSSINVNFLWRVLQQANLTKLRKKSGQPLVTQGPIHNLKIPLAPISEQDEIARVFDGLDYRLETENTMMNDLEGTKKALLSTLLTGELRVTPAPEAA